MTHFTNHLPRSSAVLALDQREFIDVSDNALYYWRGGQNLSDMYMYIHVGTYIYIY